MYVLYINNNTNIIQLCFETEKQCYDEVSNLKCRWYKIHKEKDAKNNYFQKSFEWDYETNDVKINIEKAKEIKKEEYRQLRVDLLNQLDIKYMRALEEGNSSEVSKIVDFKNKLRNLTQEDLPNSESELLYYYPNCISEVLYFLNSK